MEVVEELPTHLFFTHIKQLIQPITKFNIRVPCRNTLQCPFRVCIYLPDVVHAVLLLATLLSYCSTLTPIGRSPLTMRCGIAQGSYVLE